MVENCCQDCNQPLILLDGSSSKDGGMILSPERLNASYQLMNVISTDKD
jgi:hypothetical protein